MDGSVFPSPCQDGETGDIVFIIIVIVIVVIIMRPPPAGRVPLPDVPIRFRRARFDGGIVCEFSGVCVYQLAASMGSS